MSYATPADMLAIFGEREMLALTDRDNEGEVNTIVAQTALDAADAEINGYLAKRYVLPVIGVAPMLRTVACDIARYRLTGAETSETQPLRDRYRDAVRWLERVSSGEAILTDANGQAVGSPNQTGMGSVKSSPGRRVFTDALLSDFTFGR